MSCCETSHQQRVSEARYAFVADAERLPVCTIGEHVINGARDGTDFSPCTESILSVDREFIVHRRGPRVKEGYPLVRLGF